MGLTYELRQQNSSSAGLVDLLIGTSAVLGCKDPKLVRHLGKSLFPAERVVHQFER
jgi:hypothetical protein